MGFNDITLLIGFHVVIAFVLMLDLGVFNRKSHVVKPKEAFCWVVLWVTLAMAFCAFIYYDRGKQSAMEFLTGYIVEQSLSVDNIFVFILVFSYFKVQRAYQHRVLFYGIIGALVMRATMILAGASLLEAFHWIIYLFGAFIVVTGAKILIMKEDDTDLADNKLLKWLRRRLPLTKNFEKDKFFIIKNKKVVFTPLFVVLIFIEWTDLVFALDSIPAIFAITRDPFIVYTSNIFAILGLRSLYFLLESVIHKIHYLKIGLAFVLMFIGAKMLLSEIYKIPVDVSLFIVGGILGTSVIASLLRLKKSSS